jgi:hypothetical protein
MSRKPKRKGRTRAKAIPGTLPARDFARTARSIAFILDALPATGSDADNRARAALVKVRAALPSRR